MLWTGMPQAMPKTFQLRGIPSGDREKTAHACKQSICQAMLESLQTPVARLNCLPFRRFPGDLDNDSEASDEDEILDAWIDSFAKGVTGPSLMGSESLSRLRQRT